MPPEHDIPGLGEVGGQIPQSSGRPRYDDFRARALPSSDPPGPPARPEQDSDFIAEHIEEHPSPGLEPRAHASSEASGASISIDVRPPGHEGSVLFRASEGPEELLANEADQAAPGTSAAATNGLEIAENGDYVHPEILKNGKRKDQEEVKREQRGYVELWLGGDNWKVITGEQGPDSTRTAIRNTITQRARNDPQGTSEFIDQVMHGMVSEDGGIWHADNRDAAWKLLTGFVLTERNIEQNLISREDLAESYCAALSRIDPARPEAAELLHDVGMRIAEADVFPSGDRTFMQIWHGWREFAAAMPEKPYWLEPEQITSQIGLKSGKVQDERRIVIADMVGTDRTMTNAQIGETLGISEVSASHYLSRASRTAQRLLHAPDINLRTVDPDRLLQLYNEALTNAVSDPAKLRAFYTDAAVVIPFLPHTADTWYQLRTDLQGDTAAITSHLYLPLNERQKVISAILSAEPDSSHEKIAQELGIAQTEIEEVDQSRITVNWLRSTRNISIGQAVDLARLDNRLTIEELAERAGLSKKTLDKIINGRVKPLAVNVRRILVATKITRGSKEWQHFNLMREGMQPISSDELMNSDRGKVIEYLRNSYGLDRLECSQIIGCPPGMMTKLENGTQQMPADVRAAFLRTVGLEEGSPLWQVFDARLAGSEMSLTDAGRREIQKRFLVKEDMQFNRRERQVWLPPKEQETHDQVTQIKSSGKILQFLREEVMNISRGDLSSQTNNGIASNTLLEEDSGEAIPELKTIMEFMQVMGPQYTVHHPTVRRTLQLARQERKIIRNGRSGEILRYLRTRDKNMTLQELSILSGIEAMNILQLEVSRIYHDPDIMRELTSAMGYDENHAFVRILFSRAEAEQRRELVPSM